MNILDPHYCEIDKKKYVDTYWLPPSNTNASVELRQYDVGVLFVTV